MSHSIKKYNGHPIGIIEQDGTPWLVAVDIARALDYTNSSKVIRSISECNLLRIHHNGYKVIIINEEGIKELTTTSRKRDALQFGEWVQREVFGKGSPSGCPLGAIIEILQAMQRDGCGCKCSGGSH